MRLDLRSGREEHGLTHEPGSMKSIRTSRFFVGAENMIFIARLRSGSWSDVGSGVAHHRGRDVVQRRGAEVLHRGVRLLAQDIENPLDPALAEGGKPP